MCKAYVAGKLSCYQLCLRVTGWIAVAVLLLVVLYEIRAQNMMRFVVVLGALGNSQENPPVVVLVPVLVLVLVVKEDLFTPLQSLEHPC